MLEMGDGTTNRCRPRWIDDIRCIAECAINELCGSVGDLDAWRKRIITITRAQA